MCFGLISTHLALPYLDDRTVDFVNGGSSVHAAGWRGSSSTPWRPGARAAAAERLVIPLAIGWDSAFADPTDTASRAVHDALVHAACHGALVTAAAGNDTGGPSPGSGPLYPAAWESELAPDASTCPALEGVTKVADLIPGYAHDILPAAGGSGVPLVLSIAGVDYAGAPIAVTRPGSVTALAALAFQADSGDPASELPPPHTGTSIAAAVAGGAAASVWAYDPDLTAPEVIAALRATATPLSTFAPDQCAGKCAASRLSVAAARAHACAGAKAVANPRCPAGPIAPAEPQEQPDLDPGDPFRRRDLLCRCDRDHVDAGASLAVRARAQRARAVVGAPQPIVAGCSFCGYSEKDSAVYVHMASCAFRRVPCRRWTT